MDESIRAIPELNTDAWKRLEDALRDVSEAESSWRPAPEANSIAVIVRQLRINLATHS